MGVSDKLFFGLWIYNQILAGFPESDNDDDDLMSVKMLWSYEVSHFDTKPCA